MYKRQVTNKSRKKVRMLSQVMMMETKKVPVDMERNVWIWDVFWRLSQQDLLVDCKDASQFLT